MDADSTARNLFFFLCGDSELNKLHVLHNQYGFYIRTPIVTLTMINGMAMPCNSYTPWRTSCSRTTIAGTTDADKPQLSEGF